VSVDARVARGGVLTLWAIFFVALWWTGTADRYLGSRTQWIAPFGAVVLALSSLAYGYGFVHARRGGPALTLREAASLFALLVPLAAVLLVPHSALGSFAASRKGGVTFPLARPAAPPAPSQASFLDIRIAEGDKVFAADAGIREGAHVRLLGFVTRSRDVPPGTFELARFYVACCIADAEAVGVPIDGRALGQRRFEHDTWLQLTGSLERRGKHFVVAADRITRVPTPKQPYLSFRT
jgi:uncharacterized repeat protein (TIGR03943 family)